MAETTPRSVLPSQRPVECELGVGAERSDVWNPASDESRRRTAARGHESFTNTSDYYKTKKGRNKELYEEVASNLETAREKMSRYYGRGTRRTDVEERDWVLLKDEARSDSLAPLYRGPWHVAEKRGVNVHLSVPGVSSMRVVHLNRCKRAPAPVTEVPNSSTRQDPCGSSPTATAATPPEQIPDDIQSPTIEAEDSEAMGENEGRVTVEQQPRRSSGSERFQTAMEKG